MKEAEQLQSVHTLFNSLTQPLTLSDLKHLSFFFVAQLSLEWHKIHHES